MRLYRRLWLSLRRRKRPLRLFRQPKSLRLRLLLRRLQRPRPQRSPPLSQLRQPRQLQSKGNPPRGRNEAFAQAFLERLAGSQGSALSRHPQMAKCPFGFGQRPESTKINKKRDSQVAQYSAADGRSWKDHPNGWSFLLYPFLRIAEFDSGNP